MQFPTFTSIFVLAAVAVAVPVAEPIASPEGILARSPAPTALTLFDKRASCYPSGLKCDLGGARQCADYLYNLGTRECRVSSTGTNMCGAANCVVSGRSQRNDRGDTSSYCRDVAYGLRDIVDGCQSGSITGGTNVANGNGDFLINLTHN